MPYHPLLFVKVVSLRKYVITSARNYFFAFLFAYVKNFLYLCSRKGLDAMDDYRFTNIDQEPTDEQLSQLMREVAEEAKERWDKARTAYFAQLNQMVQAI